MRCLRYAALLAAFAAFPAGAGVLYKSVDAKGTITFSDVPPPAGAKVLEQREIKSNGTVSSTPPAAPPTLVGGMLDDAVMRANALVDQAEHALAMARRDLWSAREGLKLGSYKRTQADNERIAFFTRDLQRARQVLMDTLKERQVAAMEPGAPYVAMR